MSSKSDFLEKLRAVVLEYYSDEQFGVSELVEKFGMSRSQIHRKLKAANGKSVSQFIREVRLDEALKLLQEKDYTASEVSYMVGFNSASYFNTCFNEYFGFPPGEAKHHEIPEKTESEELRRPVKRNKRVIIWLLVISAVVITLFVIKYAGYDVPARATGESEKAKTIAVLPFKNWSGDPELEYVSDGMTDAVIRRISAISDIEKVIPFNSIIIYKDSEKSIPDIANDLNVEYILAGNFKLSGEEVMSNLDLIEVDSNKYLWSLEYKGIWNTDEIFEMQANIAENVAMNMSANISSNERESIENVPTTNAEAYKLYLNAQFSYETLSLVGFANAERLYMQAIALDSTFIEPYLGLASNNFVSGLVWGGKSQQEAKAEGNKYLELAEKLNSEKGYLNEEDMLIVRLFGSFYYNWDFVALQKQAEKIEMKDEKKLSSFEIGGLIEFHRKMGNYDKAIYYGQLGIDLNRAGSGNIVGMAFANYLKGDGEKSASLLRETEGLYTDDFFYLMESSKVFYYLKDYQKSKRNLEQFLDRFPVYPPIITWLRAMHAHRNGDSEELELHLTELRKNYQDNTSGSPAWFIALYHIELNDYDSAFEWLNKSYDHREVELTWFKEEPLLRSLREDPRYIELYNKIGFDAIVQIETIKD